MWPQKEFGSVVARIAFDFRHFDSGDYVGAVQARDLSENITKVLYPNDNINLEIWPAEVHALLREARRRKLTVLALAATGVEAQQALLDRRDSKTDGMVLEGEFAAKFAQVVDQILS